LNDSRSIKLMQHDAVGRSATCGVFVDRRHKYRMRFQSFSEYVQMREGLWFPDRRVTSGGSRINPFPTTNARLRQMKPKPVKLPTPTIPQRKPFKITPPAPFRPQAPKPPKPAGQTLKTRPASYRSPR
jgi:hypothetical protein